MPILPAFPIQNFIPAFYAGSLTAVNVWLLSTNAVTQATANGGLNIIQPGKQSLVVNTFFDWSKISGQASSLIFQANNQGAAGLLDKILMVYVNNVNNIRDCTVYFSDTGMFITVPAGQSGYYPVLTNNYNPVVFNGYDGLPAPSNNALNQQTNIIFCNFAVPGFLDQLSPKTNNFAFAQFDLSLGAGGSQQILPVGQYQITFLEIGVQALVGTISATNEQAVLLIESSGSPPVIGPVIKAEGITQSNNVAYCNAVSRFNLGDAPLTWPCNQPTGPVPQTADMQIFLSTTSANSVLGWINVGYNIV
jgi:hypothetical protein